MDDVKEKKDVAIALLTSLGYSASAFPSGEKALEYLKEHPADIVLFDMIWVPF